MSDAIQEHQSPIAWGLCFIPAAMCLVALADMPHSYYQLLRLVVCGASIAWVLLIGVQRPRSWPFVLLALLFNPIAPIEMEREQWAVFNAGAGIGLALTGAWCYRRQHGSALDQLRRFKTGVGQLPFIAQFTARPIRFKLCSIIALIGVVAIAVVGVASDEFDVRVILLIAFLTGIVPYAFAYNLFPEAENHQSPDNLDEKPDPDRGTVGREGVVSDQESTPSSTRC